MAIARNREIISDGIDRIEAFVGKRVISWHHCENIMAIHILFEGGLVGEISSGESIESIRFVEDKSFCLSCGEKHPAGYYDFADRCYNTIKKIWEGVRKCFWHRYLKNGHKLPL